MTSTLLDVHDLSVRITRDEGVVRPLNGVSFRINAGQAVGIVGESGCGKTMTPTRPKHWTMPSILPYPLFMGSIIS